MNVLEVNSGDVRLHNKVQSGNNHFVYEDKDSKQVRIKQALNINGGDTVINLNQLDSNNGADDTHVFTSFGSINFINPSYSWGCLTGADSAEIASSQITQTAGNLTVNGKTASVGGLNINQSGGTMNISTDGSRCHSWHILSDYGDSTITQSGDASSEISEIKQSGSGIINASVNMSGGTLVAADDSTIAGITATGGKIQVEGGFTMTGDMILDGDAVLIFGPDFFSDPSESDYKTINLGGNDLVLSGNSSIALTLGDADISEVVLFSGAANDTYSGYKVTLLDENNNFKGTAVLEYNENGDVKLGTAAVPEPTTATLSLLALAALAARRRRKESGLSWQKNHPAAHVVAG